MRSLPIGVPKLMVSTLASGDTRSYVGESGKRVQAMHDAAQKINPEAIVLCHGGPIAEPEDARGVLSRTHGVVGFFGAFSMERLPTEIAIAENMRRFKAIKFSSSEAAVH